MIIAECERCGGVWRVQGEDNPDVLEGACMDCMAESEIAERPLTFRYHGSPEFGFGLPDLPKHWLAE